MPRSTLSWYLLLTLALVARAWGQAVTITSPIAGALSGPVTVTGTTTGFGAAAPVTVTVTATSAANAVTTLTANVTGNTNWSVNWAPAALGDYSIRASASSTVSGTTTTAPTVGPVLVNVAGILPTCSLALAGGSSSVAVGTTRFLVATASDPDGTIDRVEYYLNGVLLATDSTAPYSVPFTATQAQLGVQHQVVARAFDNAGNAIDSAPLTLLVVSPAGLLPGVAVTNPTANATLSAGSAVTVTGTATDIDGTITSVQIYLNGASAGAATYSNGSWTYAWTPTAGLYTVQALATDDRGNAVLSSASTVSVAAPGVLPTLSLTLAGGGTTIPVGSSRYLTATVASTSAFIDRVQFYLDGQLLGTDTSAPYNFLLNATSALVGGSHALTARAFDNLGNAVDSSPVSIQVAAAIGRSPAVTFTAPVAGTSVPASTTVAVSGTATDSDGIIASVQLFVNGALLSSTSPLGSTWSINWTPSAAGTYSLTALATDDKGNTTLTPVLAATVTDPVPPTVTFTVPTSPNGVSAPVVITGTTAGFSPTAAVTVTLTATNAANVVTTLTTGVTGNTAWTITWSPTGLGDYVLRATAAASGVTPTPAAGPTTATVTAIVPSVSLALSGGGVSVPVGSSRFLLATTSDVDGFIDRVEFYFDGKLIGSDTSSPYSLLYTAAADQAGPLHQLVARSYDNAGNFTDSFPVAIQVTPALGTGPLVSVLTPVAGVSLPTGTATSITGTVADSDGTIASVQVYVNGSLLSTATLANVNWTAPWTPSLAGTYTIHALATDDRGNAVLSAVRTVTVGVAGVIPSVTVALAGGGATIPIGSSRYLTATASSSSALIDKVEFYVDGKLVGSDNTSPYSILYTVPPGLAIGPHLVTARALDNLGNSSDSAAVTIQVGNALGLPPSVGFSVPSAGAFVPAGGTVAVAGTASDPDGTVTSVQLFVNGALLSSTTPSGANWAINWTPSIAGTYALSAVATDDKGNAVVTPALPVNVTESTSPSISLSLSPGTATLPAGSTRNVVASVAASTGRAVVRVEFFVDGAKVGEATAAPYTFRYTAPASPGAYTLLARATDNAGISRDTQQVFTVTSAVGAAPNVTVLAPANNLTVIPNTAVNLAATATSPATGGSIASVQFYQNGVPVGGVITTPPYTSTYTPTTPGRFVFDAIATDDRGNTKVSNAATITSAFGTPTILISSPRADVSNPSNAVRVTPNVPLTISTTATAGNGATILLVEFLIDGIQIGSRAGSSASGTFTFPWTPDATQLGTHVLTTRVTDTNSVTAASTPINLNVANVVGTPPSVTIVSPGNGATLQSLSSINVIANSFATGGTIASVEFFLNDASIGLAAREQTTNSYRLVYDLSTINYSLLTADGSGRYLVPLYAIAKDSNGNQTVSSTYTLNIVPSQSLAPSIQLSTLAQSPTVTAGTAFPMVVLVNDPDGSVVSLQVFANGSTAPIFSQGNPTSGVANLIQFTPQTAGRLNVYAVVTDDTGNTVVSSPIVITVTGNTAPTAVLVRPVDDSTVTTVNTPVFLDATSSDPDIGQSLSVAFINTVTGQTLANGTRVGTTDTYRAIWTPTQANTYTVAVRAQDNAQGATTSTASRRVVVNNVIGIAPTISLTVPGQVSTASSANLVANAQDSDGAVVGVEIFLNRNSVGQAVRDDLANTWRLTVPFAGVPVGSTEVVALVRDNAGNVSASSTQFINVVAAQSIAPTITVAASSTNVAFSRQVQLTANARDADGSITNVQYFVNGAAISSSSNPASSYQVTWTPTQSGTFSVYAIATDSQVNGISNTTVSAPLPITVRRNNPVLDDSAFILQAYLDIANNSNVNTFILDSLDAQLAAGTLTRAQLVESLTAEAGFTAPVNLLALYYTLMGQWPTPSNYTSLLATARGSLANAASAIIASSEYLARYPERVTPTTALLNNPASVIPAQTFLNRLWQNAGRAGSPSALDLVQFMNNDTANLSLGISRGYNAAGLSTALAEFVTIKNVNNTALFTRARAAALFYQLANPPSSMSTDEIATRVSTLAALPDTRSVAEAVLKDVLYSYRYVTILKHPVSLTVSPRSGAIFTVEALGAPPLAYQWLLNGAPVPGATTSTLSLTNVDATRAGTYTVVVTSSANQATSDAATLTLSNNVSRLANISSRGLTGGGSSVLIGGFVVSGTGNQTRQMLIRAVGPGLAGAPFNVTGTLADPRLEIYSGSNQTPIVTNDNWGTQNANATANATAVQAIQQAVTRAGAFALANGSLDSAVLATLAPGNYSVQVKGPTAAAAGVVLVEVYDVTPGNATTPKAANVSTRADVGTGNNVLIAGFVVNGTVSRRMLIRGVGPTLRNFGLAANAVLADPQISLAELNSGKVLRTNDDWASGDDAAVIAQAAVAGGAFPLLNGSKDAAMIVMLPPGAYTVTLRGVGTSTGVGIVEVYDVDP